MKLRLALFIVFAAGAQTFAAGMPEQVRGVYLGPQSLSERKVTETILYAKEMDLNAVVLHAKDPFGHLYWNSQNILAQEIGAVEKTGRIEKAIEAFKKNDIWTIAKLDVFHDSLLAGKRPAMAVLDSETKAPWLDKKGLTWANPHDTEVWSYNISLAKELVALGVQEIQFDYIRFPSDGALSQIQYPKVVEGKSHVEVIAAFLEAAYAELHPLGAAVSVDLFGLVAWKSDDFGVGQQIEAIAPHVDAICPMLYPSHFPAGFLGKKKPSDFPRLIMEQSMTRMLARTQTHVRPWVQGFSYTPQEINAQLDGISDSGERSWMVWNSASDYTRTYEALAIRFDRSAKKPALYASLEELATKEPRAVHGISQVVNYTDYKNGRSTLRLEAPHDGKASPYGTPAALLATLDEAIADRIIAQRKGKPSGEQPITHKTETLVRILCADLEATPERLRPIPIYIDWKKDCRFSTTRPADWEEDTETASIS